MTSCTFTCKKKNPHPTHPPKKHNHTQNCYHIQVTFIIIVTTSPMEYTFIFCREGPKIARKQTTLNHLLFCKASRAEGQLC